jgi:sugar phosphate permease
LDELFYYIDYFKTISGYFVNDNWGLSFIVPGILIAVCGFLVWMFMIVRPEDVGIDLSSETENLETRTDSDHLGPVSECF